ncbi:hypothetical protein D3C73_1334880 [compost metagenome]
MSFGSFGMEFKEVIHQCTQLIQYREYPNKSVLVEIDMPVIIRIFLLRHFILIRISNAIRKMAR